MPIVITNRARRYKIKIEKIITPKPEKIIKIKQAKQSKYIRVGRHYNA